MSRIAVLWVLIVWAVIAQLAGAAPLAVFLALAALLVALLGPDDAHTDARNRNR